MYTPSSNHEDQLDHPHLWFEHISKVENLKELGGYKKVYVFITNANIPKKSSRSY